MFYLASQYYVKRFQSAILFLVKSNTRVIDKIFCILELKTT